jgi:hypothetical protein
MEVVNTSQFQQCYWPSIKSNSIVVIGRGRESGTFSYQSHIPTFVINTALEFYPNPWFVVMVQAHFKELKDLSIFSNSRVLLITKKERAELRLVAGCTPSIFISYIINLMLPYSKIYLQGFSMDEVQNPSFPSPIPRSRIYDWNRQVEAFRVCHLLAEEKHIEMIIIDECKKLPFIKRGIPPGEMIDESTEI